MLNRFSFSSYKGISLVRDVFIETGTYRGESLQRAARMPFKTLYSCDVVEAYVQAARDLFAGDPRISIYLGSSPKVLNLIIDPQRETTFWLDAHYQAHESCEIDPSSGECPLLEELKIIFSKKWLINPIVLIDDARMFVCAWEGAEFSPHFDKEQWPVFSKIQELFPSGYSFSIEGDVIWCMPLST